MCKFTSLGFETVGWKLMDIAGAKCKFTPLGFETRLINKLAKASAYV